MKLKIIVAGCLIGWCSLSYADKELDKILNPPDDELSKLLKSLKSYFAPVSKKEPDKCKNTSSASECNKPPAPPPGMPMMIASPEKKIERLHFGEAIGVVSGGADTVTNIADGSTNNIIINKGEDVAGLIGISKREDEVDIANKSNIKSYSSINNIFKSVVINSVKSIIPSFPNRNENRPKNNKPHHSKSTAITSDSTRYFLLGKDLAELYPTDIDKLTEACEWFKKAADAGNTEGKKAVDSKVCKELFK